REIGLRKNLAEQRDRKRRKDEGAYARQHRIRQQGKQHVGGDVAPDDGRKDKVGLLAQLQHARRVLVAAICRDLQPQDAEAEDSEIEAGEQRRLQDAGGDSKPGSGAFKQRRLEDRHGRARIIAAGKLWKEIVANTSKRTPITGK